MKLREAKDLITHYLVGHKFVSPRSLRKAVAVIRSDPRYVNDLLNECGRHSTLTKECVRLRSCVDELCELEPTLFEKQAPELLLHLESCADCREVFWDLKGVWSETTPLDTAAAIPTVSKVVKRLATAMSVIADKLGNLHQIGHGPLARDIEPVAAAMSATDSRDADQGGLAETQPSIKRWELTDDEMDCAISVSVQYEADSGFQLSCEIGWASTDDGTPLPTQIEIYSSDDDSLFHAGSIEDFQKEPFYLAPGAYRIELTSQVQDTDYHWTLPISFEHSEGVQGK